MTKPFLEGEIRAMRGSGDPMKGCRPATGRRLIGVGTGGASKRRRSRCTNCPNWRRLLRMRSLSRSERET